MSWKWEHPLFCMLPTPAPAEHSWRHLSNMTMMALGICGRIIVTADTSQAESRLKPQAGEQRGMNSTCLWDTGQQDMGGFSSFQQTSCPAVGSSTKTSSTSLQPILRPDENKKNVPFVGHWDLLHLREFREQ